MSFLAFERRWIETILQGFVSGPADAGGLTVAPGEADWSGAAAVMYRHSNGRARLGFRLAVWAVYFSPLWMGAGAATMSGLGPEARASLLDRMARHDAFVVRGLTLMLKLAAGLAMFANPAVRARSGYDRSTDRFDPARRGLPVWPSGLKAPRSTLPSQGVV